MVYLYRIIWYCILGLMAVLLSCVGLGGSVWASPQSGGVYGGKRSSDGRGREVDSTHVQSAQTGLSRATTSSLRCWSGLCDMHLNKYVKLPEVYSALQWFAYCNLLSVIPNNRSWRIDVCTCWLLSGDKAAVWASGYAADSLVHQQQEVWEPGHSSCAGSHSGKYQCWLRTESVYYN